jgi:prepilin-type N-terminal cleavage/methylation domain-containing protein
MASASRRNHGFTLIELVITITVIIVLMLLALPSFSSFRQRSALRGASEQALGFWNQARLEAAKRNELVKVGVGVSGANFCLGATTTTVDALDNDTPCDCTVAVPADPDDICDVGRFPAEQDQWGGVTLNGAPTLGEDSGVAVIEPKRTALIDPDMAGTISFAGPSGPKDYRLNLRVDRLGRAALCQSTSAPDEMSDYVNRECAE